MGLCGIPASSQLPVCVYPLHTRKSLHFLHTSSGHLKHKGAVDQLECNSAGSSGHKGKQNKTKNLQRVWVAFQSQFTPSFLRCQICALLHIQLMTADKQKILLQDLNMIIIFTSISLSSFSSLSPCH